MEFLNGIKLIDILALIVAIYEAIARVIPTVKNYTIIGRIINIVKFVSDKLQNQKNETVTTRRSRRIKS